jgi:hypothetical protein
MVKKRKGNKISDIWYHFHLFQNLETLFFANNLFECIPEVLGRFFNQKMQNYVFKDKLNHNINFLEANSESVASLDFLTPAQAQIRSSAPKRLMQNPLFQLLKEQGKNPFYDDPADLQKNLLPRKAQTVLSRKALTVSRKVTRKKSVANEVFGDIIDRVLDSYKVPTVASSTAAKKGVWVEDKRPDDVPPSDALNDAHDFRAEIRRFDYLEELRSLRINQMELEESDILDFEAILDNQLKTPEDTDDYAWDETPPDILNLQSLPGTGPQSPLTKKPTKWSRTKTFANKWARESLKDRKEEEVTKSSFLNMTLVVKNRKKSSIASSSGASKMRESTIALPAGPREFVDPAILFAEKQMEAWERMKKEMISRTGSKRSAKFKGMSSVLSVVLGLKQLGMDANLLV